MNAADKRRGLNNALEQLRAEGVMVMAVSKHVMRPVITVAFPPVWLTRGAIEVYERKAHQLMLWRIARLSGCLVRW